MRCWIVLTIVLSLFSAGSLSAADVLSQDENLPIEIEADTLSHDQQQSLYTAEGDVRLKRGDVELEAESMQWQESSGEVTAQDQIVLTSPDQELRGDSVQYNLGSNTGTVSQGSFFLREQNMHISGRSIERLGENDYSIEEGTFTTCDVCEGESPAWKFGADQLDVTLGGYARARNMLFYVNDVPALYFPYFIYPAKTERESGLLIPSAGYSSSRGFQYNAAYYQVIAVNQDATIYLDWLSEMGIGKGLEYRYIFGRDNAGEARLYHIDVDTVDDVSVDEERYALQWDHSGTLPGGVRMVADIEYVNDDDYFSDFGGEAGQYNKDEVVSSFSLSKSWGRYSLVGQTKYTKDLTDEDDDDETLQLLPRISFDMARTGLGDSIFSVSADSEYTHFWRREGQTGERLMLLPELSADFQLADVVSVTPKVAWRQRYYWGISDDSSNYSEGIPETSVKFQTQLQRVYNAEFLGASKVKHSIQPQLTYSFIPEVDQDDLPYFDSYDSIDEENEIELALVQRLTARYEGADNKPGYRDLLYLRIAQDYSLTSEDSGQRFQDLRTELEFKPVDEISFSADVTYEVDESQWSDADFDLDLKYNGNGLGFDYRYDRDDDEKYGAVNLSTEVLKPVYLSYEQRYDFEERETLERLVGFEYRHQCWGIMLSYRVRTDDDDETDHTVMVTFNLLGLGQFGNGGSSGFSGN